MMRPPHHDETLLLVEDEPLTALFLADALEAEGYRVNCCGTGFDALNYIDMEDSITAIVTDIRLELGPDGWEIARRAREQFPDAQVIYITGHAEAEFGEEKVPESVILRKPFKSAELVKAITAMLN